MSLERSLWLMAAIATVEALRYVHEDAFYWLEATLAIEGILGALYVRSRRRLAA
jgi:hypothetical protein